MVIVEPDRDIPGINAADWAQPVFDLQQMRRLRYPLTDGDCGRKAAAVSRKVLRTELPPLIAGESPVFGAVPGYPDKINPARITAFEDLVDLLSQFETEVTRINNTVDHEVRRQRTLALLQSHGSRTTVREAVVLELIRLTRDNVGWLATLDRHLGILVGHDGTLSTVRGGPPAR